MLCYDSFVGKMAINELQNFKLADLYGKLALDDEEFEEWMKSMKLIPSSMLCHCGHPMKLITSAHDGKMWRCYRGEHRPKGQPSVKPATGFLISALLF